MTATEIVVFDTETTGIPVWKEPSGGENQPHIVQLAACVVDVESRETIDSMNVVVRPDGWKIEPELVEIHGITTEHALEHGKAEAEVLIQFLDLWADRKRVAYNTTFDNRMIRIAAKRFCADSIIERWKAGEYECAMVGSRKIMGGRNPKLEAAYRHFTGKKLEGAHDAMNDVCATIEIYFAIQDCQ